MDDNKNIVLENLRTGKPHISFSEVQTWHECSFRHKLRYIDNIDLSEPSPYADFGKAAHLGCQTYLKTRCIKDAKQLTIDMINEVWKANKSYKDIDSWLAQAEGILDDLPEFMDTTFPGWTFVDSEFCLYEPINGHKQSFKGYIDAIITAPGKKRGEILTWLIDFKTCSWGWDMYKKTNDMVRSQLVYYKNYWVQKHQLDERSVRCTFVLLKRTAKPGNHCENFSVSVGPKTLTKSLAVLNNMLASVNRGVAFKNRDSCKFCSFYQTVHCP